MGSFTIVQDDVWLCFLLRGKWLANAAQQDDRGLKINDLRRRKKFLNFFVFTLDLLFYLGYNFFTK